MRLIDILAFIVAGYVAFIFVGDPYANVNLYTYFTVALALVASYIFTLASVYKVESGRQIHKDLSLLSACCILVLLIIGITLFALKIGENFSRIWVGMTFLLSYFAMFACRVIHFFVSSWRHSKGVSQRHIVIIGAGDLGKSLCKKMLDEPWAGLKPVAFFDPLAKNYNHEYMQVPVVGGLSKVVKYIESCRIANGNSKQAIEEVWVALPLSLHDEINQLSVDLKETASKLYLVPNFQSLNITEYSVDIRLNMPVMDLSILKMSSTDLISKRLQDLILSTLILVVLSPFFLLVTCLIKIDSRGPTFFKQRRYGLDGKEFEIWKFRSMTLHKCSSVLEQAKVDDPRVTRLGRWMRKYSVDELPQLFNVIKGDMSLVGPRPHASFHNEYYREKIAGYMSRHTIKPGITGLAQINGYRGETPKLSDMEQRIRYDLDYIRKWSNTLDLSIMIRTVVVLMLATNAY